MSVSEEKHVVTFQSPFPSPLQREHPVITTTPSLNEIGEVEEIDEITDPSSPEANLPPSSSGAARAAKKRWWRWTVCFHHLICLLWLGPAITLVALNLRQLIVGASIGCFGCQLNPFSTATSQQEAKLNIRDREALGGLQLASKILEIWFVLVVSGILYDLLVIFSNGSNDFPLSLLVRYMQVGDIMSLRYYPKHTKKPKPWIFVGVVAILCVAVNLMGPSTAILILPSLQWRTVGETSFGSFNGMASADPPRDTTLTNNCTAEALAAGQYSCTSNPYAQSLDQIVESLAGSLSQVGQTQIIFDPVISQEQQVSIMVNTTNADIDWIPCRQVAREISDDYARYAKGVARLNKSSEYKTISNSLDTILVRNGPTIGLAGGCYRGNVSVVDISETQSLRCYSGWNLYDNNGPDNIRCIRQGSGWSGVNAHSRFYLGDTEATNGTDVSVDVYFADQVYTLNPAISNPCFVNGIPQANPSCDWDKIFLSESPEQMRNTSKNVLWVDYGVPGLSSAQNNAWCDDIVYSGFQSYSMDPNPFSNFLHLIQLENGDPQITTNTDPLIVHPDWILAGWSVDRNGTVDGTRASVKTMISLVKKGLQDAQEGLNLGTLNFMDGVAADQGLSMINYIPATGTRRGSANIVNSSVRIYVWAYGENTRTSIAGLVVVIFGCLCVLARAVIGFMALRMTKHNYRKPRSLIKLLMAALEHERVEADEHLVSVQARGRALSFSHRGSV